MGGGGTEEGLQGARLPVNDVYLLPGVHLFISSHSRLSI
jgi:hypothetical protein